MRPPEPLAFIARTDERQHRNAVVRFVSTIRMKDAFPVSHTGPAAKPPARWIEAQICGKPA